MILVNDREFGWEEGLTVEKLIELKRYTFPKIIVKINGKLIKKDAYSNTIINDGEDIKVIHLLAGG